jgi:hypothetical protein
MVERAPEGADPEVSLTVREPEKVPAAVGGSGGEENASDESSGDPVAPSPAPAEGEGDAPA